MVGVSGKWIEAGAPDGIVAAPHYGLVIAVFPPGRFIAEAVARRRIPEIVPTSDDPDPIFRLLPGALIGACAVATAVAVLLLRTLSG